MFGFGDKKEPLSDEERSNRVYLVGQALAGYVAFNGPNLGDPYRAADKIVQLADAVRVVMNSTDPQVDRG